jgi:hypothetical protein
VLNGHVTALFADDDAAARALQGLMGVPQWHGRCNRMLSCRACGDG